jgi:hypothetical protein
MISFLITKKKTIVSNNILNTGSQWRHSPLVEDEGEWAITPWAVRILGFTGAHGPQFINQYLQFFLSCRHRINQITMIEELQVERRATYSICLGYYNIKKCMLDIYIIPERLGLYL